MIKHKGILLWIIHEGNYSGANMALMEYFEVLMEMGYQLKVISPAKGTFVNALRKKRIPVVIIPMYPWTRALNKGFFIKDWLKRNLRNSLATLQIAKHALKSNAICTNTICIISGAIAAKLSLKPHYWFVHEFGEEDHGFRLALPQKAAYKWMHLLSYKIVLNSKAVKIKWQSILNTDDKLALLYNIVKCPYNKLPKEKFKNSRHFLMLGQISAAKVHLIAIKAIAQLKDNYPDIQLDIIGSTPDMVYLNKLVSEIKKLNAQNYIYIKAPVSNPYAIFHQYRALLMCSRMEAFGRVTVEAMKSGLPVIGANTGGTSEIIINGKNGFLFEAEKLDTLNVSIKQIIEITDKQYYQIKNNAIQLKHTFNIHTATRQLNQILSNS
jgi:glycosyltransferase involved in cell wall biosynthesis